MSFWGRSWGLLEPVRKWITRFLVGYRTSTNGSYVEKLLSRIINVFSELFALSLYLRNVVIFFNSLYFPFFKIAQVSMLSILIDNFDLTKLNVLWNFFCHSKFSYIWRYISRLLYICFYQLWINRVIYVFLVKNKKKDKNWKIGFIGVNAIIIIISKEYNNEQFLKLIIEII